MDENYYDAIIIGAGFAGVTAARELSQSGYKVLILEGRDRIGGRTWLDHRLGSDLELGGSWVHWLQPYIWSELTRYGLNIMPSPTSEKALWFADGKLYEGNEKQLSKKLDKGMKELLKNTKKFFPYPYNPLNKKEALIKIDSVSVESKLKELSISKAEMDLLAGLWSTQFNCTIEKVALTQVYRLASLVENRWPLILETAGAFKIVDGTKTLIENMLQDAPKVKLRLSTVVTMVEKTSFGYKVRSMDGTESEATAVVVTVPLNVLNSIQFQPPLSNQKRQASAEKHASKGFKFFAKVRGMKVPSVLMAPDSHAINYVKVEALQGEDTLIVGFGCDSTKIDLSFSKQIEKELRKFLPGITVIGSTVHDWVADPFSGGTWSVYKINQLTNYLAELQRAENGVFLAGSDYANGWSGFIDGAIESGLTASRKVTTYLQGKANQH